MRNLDSAATLKLKSFMRAHIGTPLQVDRIIYSWSSGAWLLSSKQISEANIFRLNKARELSSVVIAFWPLEPLILNQP